LAGVGDGGLGEGVGLRVVGGFDFYLGAVRGLDVRGFCLLGWWVGTGTATPERVVYVLGCVGVVAAVELEALVYQIFRR